MGWTVILEKENKDIIKRINSELVITQPLHLFKLLRYLDPYGNTIFNNIQMGYLIEDLKILQQDCHVVILNVIIEISLVCKSSHIHMLCFMEINPVSPNIPLVRMFHPRLKEQRICNPFELVINLQSAIPF
ncbi:hypothetical protein ACVW2L_001209 [Mucilaginibacter sp. HD30]